ncbi:hypothetical protein FQN60_004531 [Etheostoma spectabile]|uniref:Uncharacterized protein n=1 Tax=Etheostoma spectabile TaxID=54343 RepID=A0A5J5DJX1_9PERO|nr:hypothetical protein FQN60_004531 [Etheostoma spectabile]
MEPYISLTTRYIDAVFHTGQNLANGRGKLWQQHGVQTKKTSSASLRTMLQT